jgi:hypothetical protein
MRFNSYHSIIPSILCFFLALQTTNLSCIESAHSTEQHNHLLSNSQDIFSLPKNASRSVKGSLKQNKYISKKIKDKIRPFLIPENHPMTSKLDAIFLNTRATANEQTFRAAGFVAIGKRRPRSFILVAKHPSMPNYLLKIYLDNELREKRKKPSWEWLVQRCQSAGAIKKIIENKKIKHFTVPSKWIYTFPAKPSPPIGHSYTRHFALLLVDDMKLTSDKVNLAAWRNTITKEHLNELYYIISHAKGGSYRPDNICFTENNTFAFIDTEYPGHKPDFNSIKPFLRPDMLRYWNKLIKNKGHH